MSDTEAEIADQMSDDDDLEGLEGEDAETDDALEQPDTDAALEQPAPRSQKEIEELQGKLEREAERHAKRVAEIMGDDFSLLVPSPVDWTPGFIFNVPEMHPLPDQVAELHALLGGSAPVELREADDAEGCDKCNALGEVLTGSRKPGQETKPCSACTGTGWRTKLRAVEPVTQYDFGQNGVAGVPITPDTYQVKDSWGRPAGHPHFGIDPVLITA